MSQGKGAASKRAKGLLIIETMNVISQLDLNLSWYEAYQMLKHGAGRVVNKRMLTGYFDRDRSELYYSPFKNEAHQYDEYRENLLSHPAILRLRNWCDSYDLYKPYVGNPHQEIVDWAKKRYPLGHGL